MLGIMITTFVVMGFALVVTHKGNGRVIPRASYDKPALQDYSKSLQRYVSVSRWLPITRALIDSQTCTDFPKTPIQSGCCMRSNPSCFSRPTGGGHCKRLPDYYSGSICAICNSCKAGILENIKMEWTHMVFTNIFIFISFIIVYSYAHGINVR
ncbi:tetraspanin-8-like [Hevea brasiliensis]|uniref:tetraspanin-8-like n=1 Tax=Hevea brasiliensis TaxID=3981 RepID=UPI0025D4BD2F|nr:tetraspanin-8-like [Hevea brasiliensis]